MKNPVEMLREALHSLPDQLQCVFVYDACITLGRKQVRNEEPFDPDIPLGRLHKPFTIDDVCDQIECLHKQKGIWYEVIIGGVLGFVISRHERIADAESSNINLDRSLRMLERMESDLQKSADDRGSPISDEELADMIQQLKDGMMRGPRFREQCLEVVDSIIRIRDGVFTPKYWDQWMERVITQ